MAWLTRTPNRAVCARRVYDASGVADLTRAMGITPPGLYAAFGGKEELFGGQSTGTWPGRRVTWPRR